RRLPVVLDVDQCASHRDHRAPTRLPTRRSADLAVQALEDVAAHQHPGGAHRQDVAHGVVLALVELAPLQPGLALAAARDGDAHLDRKSTRLNSSHVKISYAVFWWEIIRYGGGVV